MERELPWPATAGILFCLCAVILNGYEAQVNSFLSEPDPPAPQQGIRAPGQQVGRPEQPHPPPPPDGFGAGKAGGAAAGAGGRAAAGGGDAGGREEGSSSSPYTDVPPNRPPSAEGGEETPVVPQQVPGGPSAQGGVLGGVPASKLPKFSFGSSRPPPPRAVEECCKVGQGDPGELLRCANRTALTFDAAPRGKGGGASYGMVTQITLGEVAGYAAAGAAVNAAYAEKHGYDYLIVTENMVPVGWDKRYGKIWILRALLAETKLDYVFWLDGDAVVVNHGWELESLAAAHPGADLVVCREANLETNNLMNSGSMLIRNSAWMRAFVDEWLNHPDTHAIGAPDQFIFDQLYADNKLGVRARVAVLPATAFNSEPPFYSTFASVEQQPVIHLMGDSPAVRKAIFSRMHRGVCGTRGVRAKGGKLSAAKAARDWPPSKAWLVSEYTDGYKRECDRDDLAPMTKADYLNRLGNSLRLQGKPEGEIKVLEESLRIKEEEFGPSDPRLSHELGLLGNMYSITGAHEKSIAMLQRALAINENIRNPKGEPQLHLVAASLGDTATAWARQGQYGRAIPLLQRALKLEEDTLGARHPNCADTVFNLGVIFNLMGRYRESLGALSHAIGIYDTTLEPSHPKIERARGIAAEVEGKLAAGNF